MCVRTAVLLWILAGCGRLGFDATTGDGGVEAGSDSGDGGGGEDTGPAGPRWIKRFGSPNNIGIAGQRGEVVAVTSFNTSFSGDGVSGSASGGLSSIYARFGADGTVKDSRVYDAEFFCDLRAAAYDNDAIVLGGFTAGSQIPARGICSQNTSNQDPLLIRIDGSGTESILTHWAANTTNAQLWHVARYGSGQLVANGVYSGGLTMDVALPAALADPNTFIGRPLVGTEASAVWSKSIVSSDVIYPGPIDAVGTRAFLIGAFAVDETVLGTPLTTNGGLDAFVARIDENGTVVFVASIGSPQNEPDFGDDQSVAALANGGVAVTTRALGDVFFDGLTLSASDGPNVLLVLDGNGGVVHGKRMPSDLRVTAIGDTLYAAFTLDVPFDVGGVTHMPEGLDVLVVELAAGSPSRIVGVVGGTGDQYVTELKTIAPDALAISGVTTGALKFGSTTFDTGGNDTRFIGALGL